MATALTSSVEEPKSVTDVTPPPPNHSNMLKERVLSTASRQSFTLGRNDVLNSKPKPFRSSEFTRVRRMNTFKCVVKRPAYHPPLKGKALSFNGVSSEALGRRDSDAGRRRTTKESKLVDSLTSPEVQEIIMTFASPSSCSTPTSELEQSLSSSAMVPNSSVEGSPVKTPSLIPGTMAATLNNQLICYACKGDLGGDQPTVLFGDAKLHLKCFTCGKCYSPMGAMMEFLVQLDGTPLCVNCTPSCHICHKKVYHNHVSVLKKDFHEECLACSRCKRKFNLLTKVYSSEGEPCCASCITPVFSNVWSSTKIRSTSQPSIHISRRASNGSNRKVTTATLSPSPSTDSGVSDSACSNDGLSEQHLHTLPSSDTVYLNPRLESLSRSIALYSNNNTPKRMRGSISAPNLSEGRIVNLKKLSVSSLKDILFDETGSLLFVCYCVNQCAVELVAFWLDVEHFKNFDGGDEDIKIFAHHIILKYIGYFAELPIPLPRDMQSDIFQSMELGVSQTMYNEAQQYILLYMERELLPGFLNSCEGKNYIESIVEKELLRMKKKTPNTSTENITDSAFVRARVISFDKRYMDTKYYVYEVEVQQSNGTTYTIYRRYSEWYSLNQKLRKAFPKEPFPRLPKKIFLRRSQVRAVAEERMKQLQFYLQGLFGLSPVVLNCKELRAFLTQTDMDKEDEQFNKRITELQRKKSS